MQKTITDYGSIGAPTGSCARSPLAPPLISVHAVLCGVSVLGGIGVIVVKLAIHAANPVLFELLRELISAPLLCLAAMVSGHRCRPDFVDVPRLLAAGCCLFGNQMASILGLKLTSPVIATVWQTSVPLWTLSLALLFGGEQAHSQKSAGILIAVGGAAYIVLADTHQSGLVGSTHLSYTIWGHGILLFRCLCNSVYILLIKPLSVKYSALPITAWCFSIASVSSLLFWGWMRWSPAVMKFVCWNRSESVLHQCLDEGWSTEIIAPLIYEIVCCTFLGWLLVVWAMQHSRASEVAAYIVVQPATACVASAFMVLMKGPDWALAHGLFPPGPRTIAGILLVVVGLMLAMAPTTVDLVNGGKEDMFDETDVSAPSDEKQQDDHFLKFNPAPLPHDEVARPAADV